MDTLETEMDKSWVPLVVRTEGSTIRDNKHAKEIAARLNELGVKSSTEVIVISQESETSHGPNKYVCTCFMVYTDKR